MSKLHPNHELMLRNAIEVFGHDLPEAIMASLRDAQSQYDAATWRDAVNRIRKETRSNHEPTISKSY